LRAPGRRRDGVRGLPRGSQSSGPGRRGAPPAALRCRTGSRGGRGHLRRLSLGGHRAAGGAPAAMIPFVKGHGLGNDYVVLQQKSLPGPLTTAAIRRICDRNYGVGSDGILLLTPTSRADFGLRIFNPDGSEAEKSGNGLRIFAKYLWDHGHARQPTFTVDTQGGVVECQLQVRAGRVNFVTVEMGRATFRAAEIPMTGTGEAVNV